MKVNIGLTRLNHRSHIKKGSVPKFLQHIGFQEYQDNKLKDWLKKYKEKK